MTLRLLLVLLCAFVVAYQLRISLDTIHLERHLDLYVPVLFQPFTNRIGDIAYVSNWEAGSPYNGGGRRSVLIHGDAVLAVNGRSFSGMSLYLRELWKAQHQRTSATAHYFTLTISRSDGIHNVEFGFPHCTCGIPTAVEAALFWVLPPMFCVLLGFATAFLRPRAMLAWAFLGVMLSLSQLQVWQDLYTDFQQFATPMMWTDGFRIPGVEYEALARHAWAAALLACAACFLRTRRTIFRVATGISALFLASAILKAALAIAWSDEYRPFVFLHQIMDAHSTEIVFTSFVFVAGLGWLLNRRLGLAIAIEICLAAAALYWGASPISKGNWHDYADGSRRFVPSIPAFHATPGLVVLLFTAGVLAATLLTFRRSVTPLETTGILLCIPLAADIGARLGGYWYPLAPGLFQYEPLVAMAVTGVGLASLSWSVLRRTSDAAARLPIAQT